MGFELDPDYNTVPVRMAELKAKWPTATLQPTNPLVPWELICANGAYYIAYSASCYRYPGDPLPGIGVAWEPVPGKTPYTKDSELMNAETAAQGRAIIAALEAKAKGASTEEIRNRNVSEFVLDDTKRDALVAYLQKMTKDDAAKFGRAFGKRSDWTTLQLEAMVTWVERLGYELPAELRTTLGLDT